MDLKQKYTVDLIYEVEDYFMKKLQTDFDLDISLKIAELINQTVHQVLPVKKSLTSEGLYTVEFYGGVVHNLGIPTFFKSASNSGDGFNILLLLVRCLAVNPK